MRASGHRRLAAGLTSVASAGAIVLGLGLSGALGSAPVRGTDTIRTEAFTLTRNVNGTATLTLNAGVLSNPITLQNDLARYGISAKVTIDGFCFSDPAPAGFSRVVTISPGKQNVTFTINPAAMPAGTALSFGHFQLANGQEGPYGLIDTDSYTCSTAPTNQALKGAAGVIRQLALPK